MKDARKILSDAVEIRTTEEAHLKPEGRGEGHSEAIGTGFVTKSGSGEAWPDILAGFGELNAQKVISGRKPITAGEMIGPMDEDEAISKRAHPEVKGGQSAAGEQATGPQSPQTTSQHSSALPTFAGTAGSNPATGRTIVTGGTYPGHRMNQV
jgi:hypothetical protein